MYLLTSGLGGNMIGCVFVLFLSTIKGYTPKEVSLIIGVTPLIALPMFFIWGGILDKYKKVILFSKLVNLFNIITMILLIIIKDFYLFFVVNVIRTILLQPGGSLNDKYLLSISKVNKAIYGKVRVFATIGFGLSGIIAPFVISLGGVYATLIVGIILILISIFVLSMIAESDPLEDNTKYEKGKKQIITSTLGLLKNNVFIKYLIVLAIIFTTQNAAYSYGVQIMLIELNSPEEYIALIPFIMVIFECLVLLIYDKVKILKNTDNAIMIALCIMIFRWSIMTITNSYIVVLLITILHGFVAGAIFQIQNKLFGEIVEPRYQFSAFMLLGAISGTMLPSILNLITGNLYEKLGVGIFGATYLALTIIALVIMILSKIEKKNFGQ